MIKMIRLFPFLFFVLPNFANATEEIGFRDLIIGKNVQFGDYCSKYGDVYRCYDIDDLEFDIYASTKEMKKVFINPNSYKSKIHYGIFFSDKWSNGGLENKNQKLLRALIDRNVNCNGLIDTYMKDYEWTQFLVKDERFIVFSNNTPYKNYSDDALCVSLYYNNINPNDVINFADDNFYYWNEIPPKLLKIIIDVGPLYQTYLDYIIDDPNNPYNNLKNNLSKKYGIDWESTERDRNLFNEGEKDSLWSSFGDNQIFLEIRRVDYDMELFVHYLTKEDGKLFSEKISPKNANFSDF